MKQIFYLCQKYLKKKLKLLIKSSFFNFSYHMELYYPSIYSIGDKHALILCSKNIIE